MTNDVAAAWDAEYASGRYEAQKPVPLVDDIISSVRSAGLWPVGENWPLHRLRQWSKLFAAGRRWPRSHWAGYLTCRSRPTRARMPDCRDRLVFGDLSTLPPNEAYAFVIGIQVFQHGDRETAHRHLRGALARVESGGLFCLRVNSADTDIHFEHTVISRSADGWRTVLYRDGPKRGLHVHFFGASEITSLISSDFEPVVPLRVQRMQRPHNVGQWSQWEGIRKRAK
jgi:hypothetical protein